MARLSRVIGALAASSLITVVTLLKRGAFGTATAAAMRQPATRRHLPSRRPAIWSDGKGAGETLRGKLLTLGPSRA